MYNVRIIEYPTGYQVRVYDALLGVDDTNEKYKKNDKQNIECDFERDCWYNSPWTFEETFEIVEWQKENSLRASFARTKKNIYYLARSNVWEWFVTLTLSPDKVDRYDYDDCRKKVRKWLDNLKQRVAPDLYYLVVPEQHKDGAWHFHALFGGCGGLVFSDSGKCDKSGNVIYNLDNFQYGFSTATQVNDTSRVSGYICKYITKDMCSQVSGRQRYWVSKNINRADCYEATVPWFKMQEFKESLYEKMTYKKKAFAEYFEVDYFEVPKDWDGVRFIEKEN